MKDACLAMVLTLAITLGGAAPILAQARPEGAAGAVRYETLAEGVHEAKLAATDALPDVRLEVNDVLLGPGKSAPSKAFDGFQIVELKSGEVETTIDAQIVKRRPGEFWVVRPGQTYAVRNLGGPVVLHVITLVRK
jgi:quercetin dioxygenase-like cupin family protein